MPLHPGDNRLLALFGEQRDALLRFLNRRVGNAALAEDLAQQTWLQAASVGPAVRIDNPRAYLFRIASNLALDHQRHAGQGVEIAAAAPQIHLVPDPTPSPEASALHRSELRRLLRAVDRLPPRCREVFILAKVHELTYAEIGERLGIAKNTVMVHMTRALGLLDAELGPEEESEIDGDG